MKILGSVVRIAGKDLPINKSILLGPFIDEPPDVLIHSIISLLPRECKVLHIELDPQIMSSLADQQGLPIPFDFLLLLILNDHGNFRIPIAQHTPIVDVGRAQQHYPVVDNEELAVDVDDFGDWTPVEESVSTKAV